MEPDTLQYRTAKWLLRKGYSVIPVKPNKKPYIPKWTPYQSTKPTKEEILSWWQKWPEANVAVITGKVSDMIGIDVDTKDAFGRFEDYMPDGFETPMCRTPRGGWHYWFKYEEGFRTCSNVLEGVDIRADGGYLIVPPSENGNGEKYAWLDGLKPSDVDKQPIPEDNRQILIQALSSTSIYNAKDVPKDKLVNISQQQSTLVNIGFGQGKRDDSLFHVANSLVKGGMNNANVRYVLQFLAQHCDPPFTMSEADAKLDSAMQRSEKRDVNFTQEVRDWVLSTPGVFYSTDVNNFFGLSTSVNKAKVSTILGRLCEEGLIERHGKRRGEFRTIDPTLEFDSLMEASSQPVDIWLPLGLSKIAKIYPGNIVVVAGSPNAGKSSFLLACTRYNFKRDQRIRFLSSEMGIEEARLRIEEFDDITIADWDKQWEFSNIYDDFHDKLLTGKGNINVIDYLEDPEGEAWRVPTHLRNIHQKLDGAIALVAIQKNRGDRDTGVGGEQTLAKPRLYLSMDYGKAKIVKCKAFYDRKDNPNRKVVDFVLREGCKFSFKTGGWKHESQL